MSELEFNVPFQHKCGYIRDENSIEKGPQKTAATQLINQTLNHDDQSIYSDSRPHNCDESQGDGEVKLTVDVCCRLWQEHLVMKVRGS